METSSGRGILCILWRLPLGGEFCVFCGYLFLCETGTRDNVIGATCGCAVYHDVSGAISVTVFKAMLAEQLVFFWRHQGGVWRQNGCGMGFCYLVKHGVIAAARIGNPLGLKLYGTGSVSGCPVAVGARTGVCWLRAWIMRSVVHYEYSCELEG